MFLLILSCLTILLGAAATLVCVTRPRRATIVSVFSVCLACLLALPPVIQVLISRQSCTLHFPWALPFANGEIGLDPLSALFLIPVLIITPLAALYGSCYLRHNITGKRVGVSWFFFLLLTVTMVLVIIARDGILFLIAWELMTLASFFLVLFNYEDESVQTAGIHYLIAAHIGAACLFVLFILLGRHSDSYSFNSLAAAGSHASPGLLTLVFLLAVVGFGMKAGFVPFHVWLPEAHPAAPSHISALMSAVMIKTGIYGLLRALLFLSPAPAWWGTLLIGIGLVSATGGILFALAQQDIKRLLAYSSVENIGIITIGIGAGIIGMATGSPVAAALGFGGALLHTINHALFKGLLFMGAGAVTQVTGTRSLDAMGGLMKPMRWTALAFLIGSVAIAGLPPLNGFISELLVYLWGLNGISGSTAMSTTALAVITGLAFTGGLTALCFSKTFGSVFLGLPRTEACRNAREVPLLMRVPMLILAAFCVLIGLAALPAARAVMPAAHQITGDMTLPVLQPGSAWASTLYRTGIFSAVVLVLSCILAGLRRFILLRRTVTVQGTWDCGFIQPTPRMQYTASSFSRPITELFARLLRTVRTQTPGYELFPGPASFSTDTPDVVQRDVYHRWYTVLLLIAERVRRFQHGGLQIYILYIFITLIALLVWKLGIP